MRYPAEHKEEVRTRIVKTAAKKFRQRGVTRIGIAELMRELKLTHGGFYRHFKSKDALFEEALDIAFAEVGERLARAAAAAPDSAKLKAVIDAYLSETHCANPGTGCPMAALGSDVSRLPRAAARTMQRAMARAVERVSPVIPGATEAERRERALVLLTGMAGALTAARAVADLAVRRSILEAARRFYAGAFCSPHHG